MPRLVLYNSVTRDKSLFRPIDPSHIRIYACGPTVYDRIHVGNARMLVLFDLLYRVVRHFFPSARITFVRNITDVDDKITLEANAQGIPIGELSERMTAFFHEDADALGCIPPTEEPRATSHIQDIQHLISKLIAGKYAYCAAGHVLFHTASWPRYGELSRRSVKEQKAGARVEVAPYKQDPADFVLWKPSTTTQPGWDSPWGFGRPGWHIECSAMALRYLGDTFDIHGGGNDLIFPHHENEMAQSCAAFGTNFMANYWMHNGMVRLGNEKMAKSSGNFHLATEALAEAGGPGVRLALLSAHYRQPMNWTPTSLRSAQRVWTRWLKRLQKCSELLRENAEVSPPGSPDPEDPSWVDQNRRLIPVHEALADDLNTPKAIAEVHGLERELQAQPTDSVIAGAFTRALELLGLTDAQRRHIARAGLGNPTSEQTPDERISILIEQRNAARNRKDFASADAIRQQLLASGIRLQDTSTGTHWEYMK